ncbi:MAG: hypothetical protein H8E38_06130 [SAR324 cluster bacterium]|nr:hypothetical protein [SAR324 cluster bacterium]MBL7034986.1 hypothetical protein [SAR324 cluster bacterium]
MTVSIPEDLRAFGVTAKDFDEKMNLLSKSAGEEVDENEVFFSLFEDLAKKAINYQTLQMLYWNMALFKDKLGENSFVYQQKSHQSRLLDLQQNGQQKVKINSSSCCSSCSKMHSLVLPLHTALQNLPVPNPSCESTLYSANIWCNSIYLAAKDIEEESLKLPPVTESIPEPPALADGGGTVVRDSAAESEQPKVKHIEGYVMDWLFSILSISLGVGISLFSPLAGVFLVVWSIPFFPPLMLRWPRFLSFMKHSWERWSLLAIGSLLALLILLLSQLSAQKVRTANNNSPIPPYQVLMVEDQSSSTRTRLLVRIIAPEARTARERARVAMNAARQIHNSELSGAPDNPQYEYVSVILEASEKSTGQGYVLAQAEFAPDGRGRQGIMSDAQENQWKWKVQSSKVRVEPNDMNSLQASKETLETYLKQ